MIANPVEALRDIAINNLWANPHEDRQALFEMNCISPRQGTVGALTLPFMEIALPEAAERYTVFELSKVPTIGLGLDGINSNVYNWSKVSDLMEDSRFLFYIIGEGRLGNLDKSYICRLRNGNVIIAVHYSENRFLGRSNTPRYAMFYSFTLYEENP